MLNVDPDGILIGNGSDDILTILTRAFVPEGGLICSPTPSYILYKSLAEIQGARFEAVPFTADWTRLASLCRTRGYCVPSESELPHRDALFTRVPERVATGARTKTARSR